MATPNSTKEILAFLLSEPGDFDYWYLAMCERVQEYGRKHSNKTSLSNQVLTIDIAKAGFPLLHVKPTPWRSACKELLWFASGCNDYSVLHNSGVTWWLPWVKSWCNKVVTFKSSYGGKSLPMLSQANVFAAETKIGNPDVVPALLLTEQDLPYLSHASAFTRIATQLIETVAGEADHSTRMYCNLWPSEADISTCMLPPCALAYQLTIGHDGRLNLAVTQRSADLLCGVPSNVAQYAMLLEIYAKLSGLKTGLLQFSFGDLHVYNSHLEQPEFAELLSAKRASLLGEMLEQISLPYKLLLQEPLFEQGRLPVLNVYLAITLDFEAQPQKPLPKLHFKVAEVHC